MSIRGAVDAAIGIGLLPVLVVSGAIFGLWLGLGWLAGKAWESEADERGKRATWKG